MTVRELAVLGRQALHALPAEGPGLEADLLLASLLKRERTWLHAHPEAVVPDGVAGDYLALVRRRAQGEPLDYLLGRTEFYGIPLMVTPDVLVPRPETETLVEVALAALADRSAPLVADVGTGSGAIAIAIAVHHPGARVVASDVSMSALRVAAANVAAAALSERIHLVSCDLLIGLASRFDCIAANLPYVSTEDLAGVSAGVLAHEPALALDGGEDGLCQIGRLLAQAPGRLAPGGTLLAEIGSMQGDAAARLAAAHFGKAAEVTVLPDLAGADRVLRVRTYR